MTFVKGFLFVKKKKKIGQALKSASWNERQQIVVLTFFEKHRLMRCSCQKQKKPGFQSFKLQFSKSISRKKKSHNLKCMREKGFAMISHHSFLMIVSFN